MTTVPDPHPNLDEPWLAAMLAAMDRAVIGTTIDGIIVTWNNAAQGLLGYAPHETIGRPRSLLTTAGEMDDIRVLLEETGKLAAGARREVAWRSKDGSIRRLAVAAHPVRDERGQPCGILEVAQVPRIAERPTDAQPEQPDGQREGVPQPGQPAALRELVALLAHELSQPITAIADYLQAGKRLLNRAAPTDLTKAATAIGRALVQVARAADIVRRLRWSAALDAPANDRHSVARVIRQASALIAIATRPRGVHVVLDLAASATCPWAADAEFEQVLLLLMANALEEMTGQHPRDLFIETRVMGVMVEVVVANTGRDARPAVAANHLPVAATVAPGPASATLAICQVVVEAHGGRFRRERNQTGGTTFRFTVKQGPGMADAGG
ncbi:MAG TPA: PAS domain-containing protein [Acetobacteraceae bacterium]|nr:PAS domain-containing protein [Acetobacteraceae bacterium]